MGQRIYFYTQEATMNEEVRISLQMLFNMLRYKLYTFIVSFTLLLLSHIDYASTYLSVLLQLFLL